MSKHRDNKIKECQNIEQKSSSAFQVKNKQTFSETRLLLPFSSSGAIHGRVPLTPPEISV
jgi:hypothetical protein